MIHNEQQEKKADVSAFVENVKQESSFFLSPVKGKEIELQVLKNFFTKTVAFQG